MRQIMLPLLQYLLLSSEARALIEAVKVPFPILMTNRDNVSAQCRWRTNASQTFIQTVDISLEVKVDQSSVHTDVTHDLT